MNDVQAQEAINKAFPRVKEALRRFWVGALLSEHQRHGTTADEFVARLKKSRKESADAERELRAALRKKYGSGRYKITGGGDEVYSYGYDRNHSNYGWHRVGTVEGVLSDIKNGWF